MDTAPARRKKRYVVLAALTVALLFAILFPYLLSSGPVLAFAVRVLGARLPGSLSVGSWLVGWQQGILCQEIVYADPKQGIRLHIPRLTSDHGLLALLVAPRNIGLLIVDSPRLEVKEVPPSATGAGTPASRQGFAGLAPFWDQLIGKLEIKDGQLTVAPAHPGAGSGLRNISLAAALDSGIVTFTLGLHALSDQGSVKVEGTLNLPAQGPGGFDTLVADARVQVANMQLRELLAVSGKNSSLPTGEGSLGADLRFKGVGANGLRFEGKVELDDVNLHGGFLGQDTPAFQKLRLSIDDGKWTTAAWSVKQLDLTCDTGAMRGSGQYGAEGLQLTSQGRINLPALFAQFPRLLHVRETTKVQAGAMDFTVDLGVAPARQYLDLKARADGLRGSAADGELALTSPVSVLVKGERSGDDIQVNALKVDAPFFQADGRGNLHSFVLDASADLGQAAADVGQLFALEWQGGGALNLTVKGGAVAGDEKRLKVETDLRIGGLTLSHRDARIVPPADFSLLGTGTLPLPLGSKGAGAVDLQFALSSWLGETFLTMTGDKVEGKPWRGYFSTDTSLSLDSATGLLHALKILPEATVAGDMQIQATGYLGQD